jgi:hypothetical protein
MADQPDVRQVRRSIIGTVYLFFCSLYQTFWILFHISDVITDLSGLIITYWHIKEKFTWTGVFHIAVNEVLFHSKVGTVIRFLCYLPGAVQVISFIDTVCHYISGLFNVPWVRCFITTVSAFISWCWNAFCNNINYRELFLRAVPRRFDNIP